MSHHPLRVLSQNIAPVNKQPKFLVEKTNDLKSSRRYFDENAVKNEKGKNEFVSKIPIFKSRVACNNAEPKQSLLASKPLSKSCNEIKTAKEVQEKTKPKAQSVENIDAEPNCFLLSDYAQEIYQYLHQLEEQQALPANFLSKHNMITPSMRSILINWIIGIHKSFHQGPETLYLAVSIIDRVLSRERIEKGQLQLLGAAAFFVAAKFEEVYYPDVKDFVVICDNLYTKRDILKMELKILKITNFELSGPSPLHFLRRASKAAHADSRVHMFGKYLCELSLIDYQCAHLLPSLVAATSLYIALRLVKTDEYEAEQNSENEIQSKIWSPTIEFYTGYSVDDVHKHSAVICRLVIQSETSKFQNCRKKYQSAKFMSISSFAPESMKIIKKLANQ